MIPLKMVDELVTELDKERPCGDCAVCCIVMGVSELGKPYNTKCKHNSNKCDIYGERPYSCHVFECAWRVGLLGNDISQRPDKSNILFNIDESNNGYWLEVFEVSHGAIMNKDDQIEKVYKSFTGLSGIRIYKYNSKISTNYKINPEYNNNSHEMKKRVFYKIGGPYLLYLENESLKS